MAYPGRSSNMKHFPTKCDDKVKVKVKVKAETDRKKEELKNRIIVIKDVRI